MLLLFLLPIVFCSTVIGGNLDNDEDIKITRFPSMRRFDMDNRVTVSGVEIRFSDQKLPIVQALYGLRYASLGGGGDGDYSSFKRETEKRDQKPAKRRFMHSVAAFIYETPQGHLKKTSLPPVCPQTIPNPDTEYSNPHLRERLRRMVLFLNDQSEDCLNLNIFAPTIDQQKDGLQGLPVLIFVHGDSYDYGTGNAYDLSFLASYGNIICITLNYRVGILGFLTDSGSNSRGNFALFDLQAAIQWVQLNIYRFGGDPKRITLMGHHYGAALVHLFSTSTLSIGPHYYGIQRIVLLDGSANAPWSTPSCNININSFIESHLNTSSSWYSSSSTSNKPGNVFSLLQNVPVSTILSLERNLSRKHPSEYCMRPLRAPYLFPDSPVQFDKYGQYDHPHEFSKQQQLTNEPESSRPNLFSHVNLLQGQTEGVGLAGFKRSSQLLDMNQHGRHDHVSFAEGLRYLLTNIFRVPMQTIVDLVAFVYAQSELPSAQHSDLTRYSENNKVKELFTDALYLASDMTTIRQHATISSLQGRGGSAPGGGSSQTRFTYIYSGRRLRDCSRVPSIDRTVCQSESFVNATLGDDLQLMLGEAFLQRSDQDQFSVHDRTVSHMLLHFLVNFVYFGDPNKQFPNRKYPLNVTKNWPAFTLQQPAILRITAKPEGNLKAINPDNFMRIIKSYRKQFVNFWSNLFPKIIANFIQPNTDIGRVGNNYPKNAKYQNHGYPSTKTLPNSKEYLPLLEPYPQKMFPNNKGNEKKQPIITFVAKATGKPFLLSNESGAHPLKWHINDGVGGRGRREDTMELGSISIADVSTKRALLLTLVISLSIFLNMVLGATIYVCLQRRRERQNAILVSAAEADQLDTKNQTIKQISSIAVASRDPIIKFPAELNLSSVDGMYKPKRGLVSFPMDYQGGNYASTTTTVFTSQQQPLLSRRFQEKLPSVPTPINTFLTDHPSCSDRISTIDSSWKGSHITNMERI